MKRRMRSASSAPKGDSWRANDVGRKAGGGRPAPAGVGPPALAPPRRRVARLEREAHAHAAHPLESSAHRIPARGTHLEPGHGGAALESLGGETHRPLGLE